MADADNHNMLMKPFLLVGNHPPLGGHAAPLNPLLQGGPVQLIAGNRQHPPNVPQMFVGLPFADNRFSQASWRIR